MKSSKELAAFKASTAEIITLSGLQSTWFLPAFTLTALAKPWCRMRPLKTESLLLMPMKMNNSRATQSFFWRALNTLEELLGFEIDSHQDFQDTNIDTLKSTPGAPV